MFPFQERHRKEQKTNQFRVTPKLNKASNNKFIYIYIYIHICFIVLGMEPWNHFMLGLCYTMDYSPSPALNLMVRGSSSLTPCLTVGAFVPMVLEYHVLLISVGVVHPIVLMHYSHLPIDYIQNAWNFILVALSSDVLPPTPWDMYILHY